MKDILPELNNKEYIKYLNKDYDIHFCQENEIGALVEFIDTYWRKNHIFVLSRPLLDWQHYDAANKRYNFVVAKHRKSGDIHSILGFVPTKQFDESIDAMEVWPCIWKSRDDISVKGLGVSLYYYLKSNLEIETIAILGISEIALSIYKHWNFSTGKIEQYYYPNIKQAESLSHHRMETASVQKTEKSWNIKSLSLTEYKALNGNHSIFKEISRYKSKDYYINRYYNHPIYKYLFLAIMKDNSIVSIIIARECGNESGTCLRIVDYLGKIDYLPRIRYELQELMILQKYEYIDFMFVGVNQEILKNAGFINRKNNPKTIIPNYFEPFLQENIDLDYAFKSVNPNTDVLFYKADADQDRPNMLS